MTPFIFVAYFLRVLAFERSEVQCPDNLDQLRFAVVLAAIEETDRHRNDWFVEAVIRSRVEIAKRLDGDDRVREQLYSIVRDYKRCAGIP